MASYRLAVRHDTAANWTSADPTLATGEFGYESDTGEVKIGDGATAWTALSYLIQPPTTSIDDLADVDTTTVAPVGGDVLKWTGTVWAPTVDDDTEYTDADVDTHLNTSTAATDQLLAWDGSDYTWVAASGSSYGDADVDTHLNTSTAATDQLLTWDGSDYTWAPAPVQFEGSPGQSVAFDGTGDYISIGDPSVSDLAGNDFTIEFWAKMDALASRTIASSRGFRKGFTIDTTASGQYRIELYLSSTIRVTGVTGVSAGTWAHIAFERTGNTIRLYVNGSPDASTTSSDTFALGDTLDIGAYTAGGSFWDGNIADFRIVLGTALYQGNTFTPSVDAMRDVTGTSYLLDPSDLTNGGADTVNGDTVASSDVPTGFAKAASLYTDADVADYLATSGNIGIGTASPTSKLQVAAGGVDAISADVSSTTSTLRFGSITVGQGNFYTEYDRATGKAQTFIGPKGAENFVYAIDSLGGFGLGEGTPAASFHISKPAPSIRLEDSNDSVGAGTTGKIEFTSNTGVPQATIEKVASSTDFLFNNNVNGDFAFSGNSVERFRIEGNTGRVGIGTTSPGYPLHVNGDSALFGIGSTDDPDTEVRIRKRFDGTAKLSFDVSNAGNPVPCYISSDGNENLTFAYNDAVVTTSYLNIMSNGSEVARMTAAGSFGIGTSSPAEKLHVAGNAVIRNATDTSIYIRAGNTTGVAGIQFGDSDAAFRGKIEYDNSTETLSLASNGYTPADLVIVSNGDVGIGTTSPARALHVSDVMRLEPRATAPASPSAGDIFFNSTTSKLQCYDGTTWQDCF